jgi:hypothetical protein
VRVTLEKEKSLKMQFQQKRLAVMMAEVMVGMDERLNLDHILHLVFNIILKFFILYRVPKEKTKWSHLYIFLVIFPMLCTFIILKYLQLIFSTKHVDTLR